MMDQIGPTVGYVVVQCSSVESYPISRLHLFPLQSEQSRKSELKFSSSDLDWLKSSTPHSGDIIVDVWHGNIYRLYSCYWCVHINNYAQACAFCSLWVLNSSFRKYWYFCDNRLSIESLSLVWVISLLASNDFICWTIVSLVIYLKFSIEI